MLKTTLEVCDLNKALVPVGSMAGTPCVILRLAKSNLSEDSHDLYRYAWDKSSPEYASRVKAVEFEALADKIAGLLQDLKSSVLYITGGEPLVQQNALVDFVAVYKKKYESKIKIVIETNGTIIPAEALLESVDRFIVCLRLGSTASLGAKDSFSTRIRKEAVDFFSGAENVENVFSVYSETDVAELKGLVPQFQLKNVYICPAVKDFGTGNWRMGYMSSLATGYKLSPRFDVQAFGASVSTLPNNI